MVASQVDLEKPLILLVPDILSSEECAMWIERIKAMGPEAAPINTSLRGQGRESDQKQPARDVR